MGFLFTWKMTGRSRDFKMKVYPSIGYLAVYAVMMLMNNNKGAMYNNLRAEDNSGKFIVISALYFTALLLIVSINQVTQSQKFKASWIFFITPLRQPGVVIRGSVKAAIIKFYIPIVIVLTAAGLVFVGPRILPNIVLGLLNQLLIASLLTLSNNKVFPFSLQQNNNARGGAFMKNMLLLFFSLCIGGFHYFIYDVTGAVFVFIFLSAAATWYLMGSLKNMAWATINRNYANN